MLKVVLIFTILLHGSLHLIGFYRSFSKAGVIRLSSYMPRSLGILWLICSLLFLITGIFLISGIKGWVYFIMAALLISQVLILMSWKEAKFGTILNLVILILSILYVNNFSGWGV